MPIRRLVGGQWVAKNRGEWLPGESPNNPDPTVVVAGSAPVGTAMYQPPAGAVFVSPSGSNVNPGTVGAPKQTLAAAIAATGSGGTVVLRAGLYHESVSVPSSKVLTLQAYPGEAVWLDGSKVYSSWSGSGPWTAPLGVSWPVIDSTRYSFLNANDRTGELPEQVWVDGVAQKQLPDGQTPGVGQFSVTRSGTRTITLGTNPAGREVRVSELRSALAASGRTNLLGLGIRRYSPTHVESGQNGMAYYGGTSQDSLIENCVFQDSGMTGLVTARPMTIRQVTVQDCMNSGIQFTTADGIVFDRVVSRRVNRGLWQMEPIIACIKGTYSDDVVIRDVVLGDAPDACGLWFDTHLRKYKIFNVDVNGATVVPGAAQMKVGIEMEAAEGGFFNGVQHYGLVVNCRVRNVRSGLKSLVGGWHSWINCEVKDYSLVGIWLQQDGRRNGGDNQHGTIAQSPFLTLDIDVLNNDVGAGSLPIIAYHDPAANFNGLPGFPNPILGWDMLRRLAGNWFRPGTLAQLGKADGQRVSLTTLAALAASPATVGVSTGRLGPNHQGVDAPSSSIAVGLPADVAALVGVPAGFKQVGPIVPAPVASF